MARTAPPTSPPEPGPDLKARAGRLGLHGLVSCWGDHGQAPWVPTLLELEETERARRGLERRVRSARVGRFKLMADFDWAWPREIDRERVEDLFGLEFLKDGTNVVIDGPNGVGKTTIAQNLAHCAALRGHSVRFTTASELLNELASQDSQASLARRLKRVCRPQLLVIDEVGYLSYDSRYADLLFEVINRRHLQRSTVITTNKDFGEWGQVFPNAACVVGLIDRIIQRAEVISIDADSYRKKEGQELEARRAVERASRRGKKPGKKR